MIRETMTPDKILDWAETVTDMLLLIPPDARGAVLAAAAKMEAEDRKRNPLKGRSLAEIPDARDTMRIKARVVLAFAMCVTKYNSTQVADRLLFADDLFGPGSPTLLDYIRDLPSLCLRAPPEPTEPFDGGEDEDGRYRRADGSRIGSERAERPECPGEE